MTICTQGECLDFGKYEGCCANCPHLHKECNGCDELKYIDSAEDCDYSREDKNGRKNQL